MDRQYPDRPWVGVGVLLFRSGDVLLIKRGRPPRLGEWSIPGGAQHLGETAEAAARRELWEETGLTTGPLTLVGHADAIDRQGDRVLFHYTILDFAGRWIAGEPEAKADATEARFVPPDQLARYDLPDDLMRMIERAASLTASGRASLR